MRLLCRFFKKNLEDAIVAIKAGVIGNNRVVIFRQDTSSKAYINELYYDEANNKCVESRIKDISPITKNQVLSPEEISQYISLMAAIAPAERYGLVMAGHGHGWITREIIESDSDISTYSAGYNPWIPAAGAEVTRDFGESNVRMNIDEIAEGIELSGVELDYILGRPMTEEEIANAPDGMKMVDMMGVPGMKFAITVSASFIMRSTFSLSRPWHSMGAWNVNVTGDQCRHLQPFGRMLYAPSMVMGSTGVCVMLAMTNAPFLNLPILPLRQRVPSGNIPIDAPLLSMAIDLRNRSFCGVSRFTNMWPVS